MKKLGIIYSPRLSASAAALAHAVPLYRVGPEGFKSPAGRRAYLRKVSVFNWGCTAKDGVVYPTLNAQDAVRIAVSKLATLTKLKAASVPALEATGEAIVAREWGLAGTVLSRKDGLSGGRGIKRLTPDLSAQDAETVLEHGDFYVKYWKKTHEYRVHVFRGQVIDIQQKRRRLDWTGNYDPMIRNFDNGWVFCHDNLKGTAAEIEQIGNTAVQAVAALGLDFGATDVLARYSADGTLRKHVVCEINTAPGLEGQTLDKYVQAIRSYLNVL